MRPRSGCSLQVSPQNRCALAGGNFFELDLVTTAAPENCSSTGCRYVANPWHVIFEHRHQVPLSIDDGHDHRQQGRPSRLSSGHLQCHEIVGGDARGGYSSRCSIQFLAIQFGRCPRYNHRVKSLRVIDASVSFISSCLTCNSCSGRTDKTCRGRPKTRAAPAPENAKNRSSYIAAQAPACMLFVTA